MKQLLIAASILLASISYCQSKEISSLRASNLKWMNKYSALQDRSIGIQNESIKYALMIMKLKKEIRDVEWQNEEKERYYTFLRKQNDSLKTELLKLKKL